MLTRQQLRLFSTDALRVIHDVAKQQFVVSLAGEDAVLGYSRTGKEITLIHTDVPQSFQGKGVGKILAKHAFDHAKDNKLDVTCQCHFLAKYYTRNQDKYKNIKVKIEVEDEENN